MALFEIHCLICVRPHGSNWNQQGGVSRSCGMQPFILLWHCHGVGLNVSVLERQIAILEGVITS